VVGADGKPATHAYLILSVPNVSANDLTAQTDSKGEFTIRKVPPGSYVLTAAQMDDNKPKSARQRLEVGESNLESIVLAFGGGINIPGRVTSETSGMAFDRMHLFLESQDGDEGPIPSFAQVKSDGSFQLTDVPDGNYIVNFEGLEKGWFPKAIHFGSTDVLQNGLQIERGSTAGNLELLISSASAQLDGVVNDQDGKPIVAAQVRVRPDPETDFNRGRAQSTGTDQNGRFSFPSLATGKYKVSARLPGATPDIPALNSDAQSITLKERDHQSLQFELTLPKEDQ